MNTNNDNNIKSQIEFNKTVIHRYFEAYNNKDEAIFDEIISPDYIDHGQSAYMGSPGMGLVGAKNDLRYSLDRLDELNYVVEVMIASEAYPDLVGAYWKGTLIPKATTTSSSFSGSHHQTNKEAIIHYRGISIYRIQNGKMVETWHVFDGLPSKMLKAKRG